MARGVFTTVYTNQDLSVITTAQTDTIDIGSGGGLDSVGSVSIQFTCDAQIDSLAVDVRSDASVPFVSLNTNDFPIVPAGPFASGTHIAQLTLPTVSEFRVKMNATSTNATNIRINVQ